MSSRADWHHAPTGSRTTTVWTPLLAALAVLALLSVVAIVELGLGREPMCTCGTLKLWHGIVKSAENSQQIFDWYTFTHVLHGLAFYALLSAGARRVSAQGRLLLATAIEGAWEIAENSPTIIDRYRATTIAFDYYGDSVVNSLADIVAMMAGFWLARRLPVRVSVLLFVAVELALATVIRDNLTLNVIMLIHPFQSIKAWQLH